MRKSDHGMLSADEVSFEYNVFFCAEAAFLYYPYYAGFNIFTFFANWIRLVCFNFPFAFFSQLFFIQPFIRTCFKAVFRRKAESAQTVKA
ncbi:hypothetical protein [Ruminococcus sp. HUN007]|uniref:hypothetical protein n=1 Tax=Ruminococcus sp. HUN007 TaxID=1514668 RepID=UPI000A826B03|nr:hypothetical protein [Ruminococcus sp. HUN007]